LYCFTVVERIFKACEIEQQQVVVWGKKVSHIAYREVDGGLALSIDKIRGASKRA
jgi:hypothetical protein